MDEHHIGSAVVGSLSAVMYRNCQMGNEELARDISDYRVRLYPSAVINPSYAGWETDLQWCIREMGVRGVRIYPQHHGYSLTDTCCDDICRACRENGLLLTLVQRQVDYRQKHRLVSYEDLVLDDIAQLCENHPEVNFILLNGSGYPGSRLIAEAEDLPDNYHVEISRSTVFIAKELQLLVEILGSERVLFGTGMPLKMAGPVLLKMKHLETSREDKRNIHGGNLSRLLGLTHRDP